MKTWLDRQNAEAIKRALEKRGGACAVRSLPLLASDDETICRAIERMDFIDHPRIVRPNTVVRLR
jgi:hypothetical protein